MEVEDLELFSDGVAFNASEGVEEGVFHYGGCVVVELEDVSSWDGSGFWFVAGEDCAGEND